jgi:hypothetical protein
MSTPTTPTTRRKLSPAEIAVRLGLSVATIHRISQEALPRYRAGRASFAYEDDVAAYERARVVPVARKSGSGGTG